MEKIDHFAAEKMMRTYVSKALGSVKVDSTSLKLFPSVQTIPTRKTDVILEGFLEYCSTLLLICTYIIASTS